MRWKLNTRLINSMTAKGVVVEIKKQGAVVNIGTNDEPVLTPPIPWGVPYAGTLNSQRVPSVGECVVLLNTGDTGNLAEMVIVAFIHGKAYPSPSNTQDALTIHSDGFKEVFNTQGQQTIEAKNITITADKVLIKAAVEITKTLKAGASTLASAVINGIKFITHKHMEQGDGKPTGGAQ